MKSRKAFSVLFLLMTLSTVGFGQATEESLKKNPLHLTVDLGVLITKSTSTLDTNGNEEISDNTEKGDSPRSVWALPLFDIRYMLTKTGTQLFLGTPIEGSNIALSAGVVQPLPKMGILSLSVAPSMGMTLWKNPYAENVKRKQTAVDLLTTQVKLDRVGFTPVSVQYVYRRVDVAEDEIGVFYDDLRRDGNLQLFQLTYDIGLNRTSLVSPGLMLEKGDYEGDSNSYQKTGGRISYKRQGQRLMFLAELSAGESLFEKVHPVYNKTKKETHFNLFGLLRINQLWDIPSLHSNLIIGGGNVNSNIEFFDSTDAFLATTIGYSF